MLESYPYHEARFEAKALVPGAKSPAALAAVMAVYSIYRRLSRVGWTITLQHFHVPHSLFADYLRKAGSGATTYS